MGQDGGGEEWEEAGVGGPGLFTSMHRPAHSAHSAHSTHTQHTAHTESAHLDDLLRARDAAVAVQHGQRLGVHRAADAQALGAKGVGDGARQRARAGRRRDVAQPQVGAAVEHKADAALRLVCVWWVCDGRCVGVGVRGALGRM